MCLCICIYTYACIRRHSQSPPPWNTYTGKIKMLGNKDLFSALHFSIKKQLLAKRTDFFDWWNFKKGKKDVFPMLMSAYIRPTFSAFPEGKGKPFGEASVPGRAVCGHVCVPCDRATVTCYVSLCYCTMHIGEPIEATDKTCLTIKILLKKW